MSNMKFALSFFMIVLATGCSDDRPAPQIESANFNGIKFPGRASDAKTQGFTNCKAEYYGYTCRTPAGLEVLDVASIKSSLTLTGRDVFTRDRAKAKDAEGDVRLLAPDTISYDEVSLEFNSAIYDDKCTTRMKRTQPSAYNPRECLKPGNSIAHLKQALDKAGWRIVNARRYSTYMHPNEGVSITTQDNNASIRRVDPAERSSTLAYLTAREAEAKAKESAGQAFVQKMAK